MAVVPVLPPVATGVYTSSSVSAIVAAVSFVMNKPAAELRQTVAQSLTTATWTTLTFDVEDLDNDPSGAGGHSTSVNTSRYTAVYPGWYLLGGSAAIAANATGFRGHRWAVNGTAINQATTVVVAVTGNSTQVPACAVRVYLNVGDYVEAQAYQTSGGALSTFATATAQPNLTIGWERN